MRSVTRRTRTFIVVCIVLAGCSVAAPSPPGLQPTALSPALEAAVRDAIRLRTEFGLRADEAYVRQLANDPTAVVSFGIPMLPGELAELQARIKTADGITDAVDAYAATVPDVFGGQYIDSTTGTVYALFTDDLAVHRAALAKLLHPSAPVVLLQARYSDEH
jgi:hypothetical protein